MKVIWYTWYLTHPLLVEVTAHIGCVCNGRQYAYIHTCTGTEAGMLVDQ